MVTLWQTANDIWIKDKIKLIKEPKPFLDESEYPSDTTNDFFNKFYSSKARELREKLLLK